MYVASVQVHRVTVTMARSESFCEGEWTEQRWEPGLLDSVPWIGTGLYWQASHCAGAAVLLHRGERRHFVGG